MPARYAPILFGFILSGLMSFIVSGVATVRNFGLVDGVFGLWVGGWLPAWMIAFPVVLFVAPIARRIVGTIVRAPAAGAR